MQIDDLDRRNAQIQQILNAVAIRFKSLGCAVIIQPQVVSGRYATSLIIGESRDAAAHLHTAENIGVQVVESIGDPDLQLLFAQLLFSSAARLSELTLPRNPSVQ
jgi:hypothetical protein